MRRAWGVVLAAVLLGAATCGSEPGPGLSPPGTPLAAGLEVPVGTQLVGPVFPRVPYSDRAITGHVAVLRVDGNPFTAWDDLAGQAQDLGVPIPSSGICTWWGVREHADHSAFVTVPVSGPRPDVAEAMSCDASATGPLENGTGVMVTMNLWWWAAGAELHVDISEGVVGSYASSRVVVRRPAPPAAVSELPDREPEAAVDPGHPFGRENNCFETRSDRLDLPSGARLLGGGTTPVGRNDFTAVLAVEDPETALAELRDQLDDPEDSSGDYRLSQERLAGGATVWSLSGDATAGGGACSLWSSPDGRAVLVTTASD